MEVLTEEKWADYFSRFQLISKEQFELQDTTNSRSNILKSLEQSHILDQLPAAGIDRVHEISERMKYHDQLFAKNRSYMSGLTGIWRKA